MPRLLIVFAVIIILAIGIPLAASYTVVPKIKSEFYRDFPKNPSERKEYVFDASEPWDQSKQQMKYFGYKTPSDSDLKKLKEGIDLTRRYPDTLKAVFSPGPVPNTTELLYFSDELANIGVNTYWVIGEYRIANNKASQFMPSFNNAGLPGIVSENDAKKILAWRILLAKKAGFATILIPDFPSAFNIGRDKFEIVKLKPEFERVALDLAKLAEEYKAEYFAPVNEYDHMLLSNGYPIDELANLQKEFYDEIIPKVKKIYSGKIVIKTGNIGEWSNFPKLSMKGADLFGVGNAYTGAEGMTAKDETEKVQAADLVSERDNVPWFESEFLVYRPVDQQNWLGRIDSTYPMDKTYQEGTSAFEKTAKRAVGFTFMSFTGVGRIRNTEAAAVIKDFFARWKPTPKAAGLNPDEFILNPEDEKASFTERLKNIPQYYLMVVNLFTGKAGPQKESFVQEGGPGGCKSKAECEAYCAKPENADTCKRFGGDSGEKGQNADSQRGGPGGCKSDTECQAYCSKKENQQECLKFKSSQQNQ